MSNLALVPVQKLEEAVERYNELVGFTRTIMKEGLDFGTIPGTGKPTLYKAGAEKLGTFFGLVPYFEEVLAVEDWTGKEHGGEPFFYYKIKCVLKKNDYVVAECIGSCNSWEERYRWRKSERICPMCGKPAIIKGKAEFGGGFLCWTKKDGCGNKFKDDDKRITDQPVGQIPNPQVFDQVNTFVKQSEKRSYVGAILLAVNASEFYTQDMEDIVVDATWKEVPEKSEEKKPVAQTKPSPNLDSVSEPIDDWYPPSEDSSPVPAPITAPDTPFEENGIIYRKKGGDIQLKFGTDWRSPMEQAKLSPTAAKQIESLFKNGFELEGHLFKHFQVKSLASLNWQQVLSLLNFKKKNIRHPIYYGEVEAIPAESKPIHLDPNHRQNLLGLFNPGTDVPDASVNNFLDEAAKLTDPKSLKVLFEAGLNLKDHAEELTSIVNIIASSPEDYPLLLDGKLSPQVKELVDHARSSAH